MAADPLDPDLSRLGARTVADLESLCRLATTRLDLRTASVTVMGARDVEVHAAAADELGERLDTLQFALGEGPRHDCFRSGWTLLKSDLGLELGRWPAFVPAAQQLGACAAFAFPLGAGAARLGALVLYDDEVRRLTADQVTTALTCADIASDLVLGAIAGRQLGPDPATRNGTGGVRSVVYQAQGMVMVQLGVDLPAAMARLRAFAWSRGLDLDEVAADVVSGRLVIPRWDDDDAG